jgi:hypothetical protein
MMQRLHERVTIIYWIVIADLIGRAIGFLVGLWAVFS